MKFIVFILSILFSNYCLAQNKNDSLILADATKGLALIDRSPLLYNYTIKDTITFHESLRDQKPSISDSVLIQLISNEHNADTSNWTDRELPNSIIVHGFAGHISFAAVKTKLNLTDKKKLRLYKRLVRFYNSGSTDGQQLTIDWISRPVYDNSGKYAMIQNYSRCNGMLCGQFELSLYHLENGTWINVGFLEIWAS